MKWLEAVRMRSGAGFEGTGLLEKLDRLVCGQSVPGLKGCLVCSSSENRDVLVLLTWESDQAEFEKSRPGSDAAAEMSRHGLVNHSIWKIETSTGGPQ